MATAHARHWAAKGYDVPPVYKEIDASMIDSDHPAHQYGTIVEGPRGERLFQLNDPATIAARRQAAQVLKGKSEDEPVTRSNAADSSQNNFQTSNLEFLTDAVYVPPKKDEKSAPATSNSAAFEANNHISISQSTTLNDAAFAANNDVDMSDAPTLTNAVYVPNKNVDTSNTESFSSKVFMPPKKAVKTKPAPLNNAAFAANNNIDVSQSTTLNSATLAANHNMVISGPVVDDSGYETTETAKYKKSKPNPFGTYDMRNALTMVKDNTRKPSPTDSIFPMGLDDNTPLIAPAMDSAEEEPDYTHEFVEAMKNCHGVHPEQWIGIYQHSVGIRMQVATEAYHSGKPGYRTSREKKDARKEIRYLEQEQEKVQKKKERVCGPIGEAFREQKRQREEQILQAGEDYRRDSEDMWLEMEAERKLLNHEFKQDQRRSEERARKQAEMQLKQVEAYEAQLAVEKAESTLAKEADQGKERLEADVEREWRKKEARQLKQFFEQAQARRRAIQEEEANLQKRRAAMEEEERQLMKLREEAEEDEYDAVAARWLAMVNDLQTHNVIAGNFSPEKAFIKAFGITPSLDAAAPKTRDTQMMFSQDVTTTSANSPTKVIPTLPKNISFTTNTHFPRELSPEREAHRLARQSAHLQRENSTSTVDFDMYHLMRAQEVDHSAYAYSTTEHLPKSPLKRGLSVSKMLKVFKKK